MKLYNLSFLIPMALLLAPFGQTFGADEYQIVGNDPKLKSEIEAGQKSVDQWLSLIDSGQYAKSWQDASLTFRLTIKQKEWEKAMDEMHKAYGKLTSRKLLDIRTAKDPQNLPKGDYLVFFYKSSYTNKKDAYELLTLIQESDGAWRILTYESK